MTPRAQDCQALIADVLHEGEGMKLMDLALLIMGTVHLEELLEVVEAAKDIAPTLRMRPVSQLAIGMNRLRDALDDLRKISVDVGEIPQKGSDD